MIKLFTQGRISAILCLLIISFPAVAELSLSLDRTTLSVQDSATLTIEIPGQHQHSPDLSLLQDDFILGSPQRSTLTRHSTQGRDIRTRWQVTLRPKHTGLVQLPPIHYANQVSPSLSLRVVGTSIQMPPLDGQNRELFVSLNLDKQTVYRNAQILLSFAIYHRDPLPETAEFIPPYLAFGQVRTLGEPNLKTIELNQEPFYLTELYYALFPDEEGFIEIEAPGLRLPDTPQTPEQEILADNVEIEVLPQAHITSQNFWLPASDLFISDLTRSLEEPQPRLIRHLNLIAQGLTSDRLPEQLLDAAHYSHYRLLSRDVEEHTSAQGVTTLLQELWLIEPEASGLYEHPGVDLHWWDTQSEQGRVLSTPHSELEIALPEALMAAPVSTADSRTPLPLAWISLLSGGALLLLAAGSWMLQRRGWRLRGVTATQAADSDPTPSPAPEWAETLAQQQAYTPKQRSSLTSASTLSTSQSPAQIADEALAFQILAASCERNDMHAARSALVSWSRSFWPDHAIQGLDAIYEVARNQTLNFLILDLEHHLLHPHEGVWQGDLLLQAIQTLRKRRQLALSR